ncbi:tripartite tricarboxylate transporter TctB family protein [Alkalilacustris brevis]|uniref:tripartite tricarboxylate transporter TctB family protein n=1 Tax=Alkalilacustris brevis TaxID=2026338 RepID=UPI0013905819|nr:tripartite tricarboxylate transporter TctB family protein [Alkalilacustris brevis]
MDKVELLAAAFMFAVGVFFFVGALDYQVGTMARTGPGFLPLALGIAAMILGVLIAIAARGQETRWPELAPRALVAVLGAILAFALLLPRLGLVPSIVITVLIAVTGNRDATPLFAVVTAVLLSFACWLLFIQGLGLSIPAFRNPF